MLTPGGLYGRLLVHLQQGTLAIHTLPGVALEVLQALHGGEDSVTKIARLVGLDVALTAHLIRVANSPRYRPMTPVTTVRGAVTRLGSGVVRNLVNTFSLRQLFRARGSVLNRLMQVYWVHSTRVAAASYWLAKECSRLAPDQALFDGLGHNIGVVPLLSELESQPGIERHPEWVSTLIQRLYTHAGAKVLATWGFEQERVSVARDHLDFSRDTGPRPDYTDVVMIANLHVNLERGCTLKAPHWSRIPAFAKFGLEPAKLVKRLVEAGAAIDEIEALFFPAASTSPP